MRVVYQEVLYKQILPGELLTSGTDGFPANRVYSLCLCLYELNVCQKVQVVVIDRVFSFTLWLTFDRNALKHAWS